MVWNVSKQKLLKVERGHLLTSKTVLEPCKRFYYCYKLHPKHDQNFRRIRFQRLSTLQQVSYTVHIAYLHRSVVNTSGQFFLTKIIYIKLIVWYFKTPGIVQFIKTTVWREKKHFRELSARLKKIPTRLSRVSVLLALLRKFVSMSLWSFDKENN